MSKHMVNKRAVCPYYRHEDSQVIYCDGVVEDSVLHLAFANRTRSKAYKETCCRMDYRQCRIYRMLEANSDERL